MLTTKIRLGMVFLLVCTSSTNAQTPEISASSVVTAGSYSQPIAPGSLVSVFGNSLADQSIAAASLPLPTSLAGTSVLVNGTLAPVLFVSPRQVNIQVPYRLLAGVASIRVRNSFGESATVSVPVSQTAPSVFTQTASRCGPASAIVFDKSGRSFVNSSSQSASPGDVVSIFGTGFGAPFFPPNPGYPAPADPLAFLRFTPGVYLGEVGALTSLGFPEYCGLAPGLVGVDQINVRLPANSPQGCRVPLRVASLFHDAATTYLSVRDGGGACVEQPRVQLGEMRWTRKEVLGPGIGEQSHQESFSARFSQGESSSLLALQFPPLGFFRSFVGERPQPGCGDYTGANLSVGQLTLRTGGGAAAVVIDPIATVWGEYLYSSDLPPGSVGERAVGASAAGAGTVDSFYSEVLPVRSIEIATDLSPGTVIRAGEPFSITWTGGTSREIVHVKIVSISRPGGERLENGLEIYESADVGAVTLLPTRPLPNLPPTLPISSGGEIVVTIRVLPAEPVLVKVRGVSLDVRHATERVWEFRGLSIGAP
jgi:uncharacterized protein (TIGR03437 family)